MRNKLNTDTDSKIAGAPTHFFPSKFALELYGSGVSAITLSLKELQDLGSNLYCFHLQP